MNLVEVVVDVVVVILDGVDLTDSMVVAVSVAVGVDFFEVVVRVTGICLYIISVKCVAMTSAKPARNSFLSFSVLVQD